ncbi:MAG: MarR family transcriptional regulator [Nanoarchaeota archaeon]|nr:MarR family transcriptional regulator [Nanoarchaeota archaeon]
MKNKNVGYLIIGISIIILLMILIFNQGMTKIVNQTCPHGPSCAMYGTIKTQTYLSLVLAALILIIGVFLVFSKEEKEVIIKKIFQTRNLEPKKFNKKSLDGLNIDEKKIINLLLGNKGNMFQSDIIQKTNINKVKMTRILDNLESQGLLERKRRGMTNLVVLK